jgi:uncharacterized coiled-coil DUF342 family protein
MVCGLPLVLLLAAGNPAWDARAELNAVATRIEQLKVRHMAGEDVGRELVALLVRAQELAGEIERREARAPAPPPAPASELRERADALHDEADRIASALAALEGRIVEAHQAMTARSQRGDAVVANRAALGAIGAQQPPAIHADEARLRNLLAERARLSAMLSQIRAKAAALEAEARAAER